jgi:predicted ATPase/DNA-binding SARP family transcriptional activator
MVRWRIELLGGVRAVNCEREITRFRTQKSAALLAYLAYYRDRPHPRECLIEMFWPESVPAAGRQSLSQALSHLRHPLEPPGAALIADRSSVRLNACAITTDVAEFEAALRSARAAPAAERREHLARAVGLFRGELLPLSSDDWVLHERPWLTERYFGAQAELLALLEASGERHRAVELARRGVAIDPLREEAHRELIRLLLAVEEPTAALRQYRELERLLHTHLGVTPDDSTRALVASLGGWHEAGAVTSGDVAIAVESLLLPSFSHEPTAPPTNGSHEALAPAEPFPDTPPTLHGDLPLSLTRFFGREEEIALLCELLGNAERRTQPPAPMPHSAFRIPHSSRLVTLTGPGGSGKTRLALEVARRIAPAWEGAVWFVTLADHGDGRQLPEAIRDAMGLPRLPEVEPLAQVTAELAKRPSVLLLDNLEHLVDTAAPLVDTLLERVPHLTCLVTSRRRLDLDGEREFPVSPLPVPHGLPSPHWELIHCPSVQLFIDRAQAVRPDFQLTAGNTEAVASLCRQLEGIPLALELAAARVWVLSPSQMVSRIGERLEWLTTRRRGVCERHRTMRAAVEWSYQLLAPELRRFLTRLAVFVGGWTAEAAEAICEEPLALDALEELRDCSLVLAEECDGEVRFRMLEMVREFAADQLSAEEQEAVGDRHCRFFVALAETLERRQSDEPTIRVRLQQEREHPNIRAAMEWTVSHGDVESARTLFHWHWWWWDVREAPSQLEDWCRRLLAAPGAAEPSIRADLYGRLGAAAQRRFDYDTARRCFEHCLAVAVELGEPVRLADAFETLGHLALQQCDYEAAEQSFSQSLALYRKHGHEYGVTTALGQLWNVACARGDEERAGQLADEWLTSHERSGRWRDLGWTLYLLGDAAWKTGDFERAGRLLEECRTFCRGCEDLAGESGALKIIGRVAREQGDHARALALLEECFATAYQCGGDGNIAPALKALGELALDRGDATTARAHLERCLAMWRGLSNLQGMAESFALLGQVACLDADSAAARAAMEECLALYERMRNPRAIAEALEALAIAVARFGTPAAGEETPRTTADRAVLLLAAAQSIRERLGARLPRRRAAQREERLAAQRAILGDAAFAAAWEAGRAMTAREVIARVFP